MKFSTVSRGGFAHRIGWVIEWREGMSGFTRAGQWLKWVLRILAMEFSDREEISFCAKGWKQRTHGNRNNSILCSIMYVRVESFWEGRLWNGRWFFMWANYQHVNKGGRNFFYFAVASGTNWWFLFFFTFRVVDNSIKRIQHCYSYNNVPFLHFRTN